MDKKILKVTYDRIGFKPTEAQWPILECDKREIVVTGGERGGKSLTGAMYLKGRVWEGIISPEKEVYWIAAKDYSLAREEFEYCLNAAIKLQYLKDPNSYSFPERDQCSMTLLNDTKIITLSLRDPFKIAAVAPKGILVCEAAQIDYEAWLRMKARTAEKRAWIMGIGTLEVDSRWFPDLVTFYSNGHEYGQSFNLPSWSNTYVFPGGRDDPEIKHQEEILPKDLFLERFAAVPCKPSGVVIREFSNQIHVGDYPYNPNLPVEIAVDPGYGPGSAHVVEAVQFIGDQIVLVDEIYLEGKTTEVMIEILKQRPWGGNVSRGAIDIYAKQHHATSAPIEIWRDADILLKSERIMEEDGIDMLRTYLKVSQETGKAKIAVNHKCKGFIAECGGGMDLQFKELIQGIGPWLRDKDTGKTIDRNNHATKAMIYYLVNKFGWVGRKSRRIRQKYYMG